MKGKIKFKRIYIDIIFPVFVITNILSASILAFPVGGQENQIGRLLKLIRYVIYAISIFYGFSRRMTKHSLLYSFLISIVVLISLIANHNVQVICGIFILFALIDYPWDLIVRRHYQCLIIGLVFIVGLSQLGIIEDVIRTSVSRSDRHFLGFNWVTYASVIWFFVTLAYYSVRKGKATVSNAITMLIVARVLYLLTDARMSYWMTVIAILFYLLYSYLNKRKKKNMLRRITSVTIGGPMTFAICSIAVHALYSPSNLFLTAINRILSERLYFGKMGIINYGIKLIGGQVIEWQGFDMTVLTFKDYNYVDCAYLHILLEYGGVFLVVFCILLTTGIYQAYKKQEYYLCWAIFFICALGMVETWLLNFTFNPFLWCGVCLIRGNLRRPIRINSKSLIGNEGKIIV